MRTHQLGCLKWEGKGEKIIASDGSVAEQLEQLLSLTGSSNERMDKSYVMTGDMCVYMLVCMYPCGELWGFVSYPMISLNLPMV